MLDAPGRPSYRSADQHPLELPVPKSTPISSPLSATFVPSLGQSDLCDEVREDSDLDALTAGHEVDRLGGLVEGEAVRHHPGGVDPAGGEQLTARS